MVIAYGPSILLWGALLFFPVRAIWRRYKGRASGTVVAGRD